MAAGRTNSGPERHVSRGQGASDPRRTLLAPTPRLGALLPFPSTSASNSVGRNGTSSSPCHQAFYKCPQAPDCPHQPSSESLASLGGRHALSLPLPSGPPGEGGREGGWASGRARVPPLPRPPSAPPLLAPCSLSSARGWHRGPRRTRMRAEGGAAGRRTGNLETKFRAPPPAALPCRLAPRTRARPPAPPQSDESAGSRVRHVWFLQRRRYEESGSAAPAGGRAQPREGFPGRCRFETVLSAERST
uniref:Uncharacterized protein n=1 Tax=Equus asinus TaxID=9793 RepID=A0A9L0J9A7_EQUAS